MRLKGKRALITGASRGIGEAIARVFAQEGAEVILTDVDDSLGEALAKELGATYHHLDVSQEADWERVFSNLTLDVLVNNAGISGYEETSEPMNPEECSLAHWNHVHEINLTGVFLGCRYAIRAMKERGGSIINISSRSGVVGVPHAAPYASSKAAIRNHTKTVALYCAQKGYNIRCNALLPATILTPMWELMLKEKGAKEAVEEAIPLRRFGKPEEVGQPAVFLASEESSYMTGSELLIDGGILAGSAASPKKKSDQ